MHAWTSSFLIALAFIPIGIAIVLALKYLHYVKLGRIRAAWREVLRSTPWHFYFAWVVMFGIWGAFAQLGLFRVYFGLMAAFELIVMLQVIVRDRVQFRLSGLLLALTACALWTAVFRVLGSEWIALTGFAAAAYSMLCLCYLWLRKLALPAEPAPAKINS